MDPAHVPQPPSRPAPSELPHLVVDEPKRSRWVMAGITVLSLALLAIPLGIFLVSQRTQIAPQAATEEVPTELSTGILLESKLSLEGKQGIIPVDIYVKSEIDPINLANVQISFDPKLIAVDKIATSAADLDKPVIFNKWLEVSKNNTNGKVSIIAGLPNPGITSSGNQGGKIYLATLHLRPKNKGSAVLQVTPDSEMLRNSDNVNVFKSGNDLVLNLTSGINEASPAAQPSTNPKANGNTPLVVITNPVIASNYSYFKPIDIIWSSFNVERIAQINLYINNELFGPIAQNLEASSGKYTWPVKETLALPYIQLANVFSIQIVGVSKTGEIVRIRSGPFGIIGLEEVTGSPPNQDTFSQNQLTIQDSSRLLSNYLVLPLKDKQSLPPSEIKSLDFNKDDVINDLDFYLIRQNLLGRGIIR